MKQYTTPEQTAKLIELGFEKPKTPISYSYPDPSEKQKEYEASLGLGPYLATVDQIEFEYAYSIGELIEILPKTIIHEIWWGEEKGMEGVWGLCIDTEATDYGWDVTYTRNSSAYLYRVGRTELIDALYDMIVKLKEEGVI